MASTPLSHLRQRFDAYTRGFAGPDGQLGPMFRLKAEHSCRVGAEARAVAAELGWPPDDQDLAEAAGLLHDVGRFEQFRRFGTFADARSMDHGELGGEVLAQTALLSAVPVPAAEAIRAVVVCHNRCQIPTDLAPALRALVQLIRDVDKLDIMALVEGSVRSGAGARERSPLLHISADGPPTPELVAEVSAGGTGSYGNVRTLADVRLVGASWTRDIVYRPVLERVYRRGLTTGLAESLAAYPDVRHLAERLLLDMHRRIAEPIAAPPPAASDPASRGPGPGRR